MVQANGTLTIDGTLEVKGTPVHALVEFVNARLTSEQKAHLIKSLPPEAADLLKRRVILPLETFPVTMLNRLTEGAAREVGTSVDSFAREAGRAAADEAVHGIWKLAASLLTPTSLLAKGSRLWSTVYSRGRLDVETRRPGEAVITLSDFPVEAVCCARITGWFERMFEVSRASNVRITHTECYSHGAPACKWTALWD